MNGEFQNWLDRATAGLPPEIQIPVRAELAGHYHDALADDQRMGQPTATAHERVMTELGDAAETASGLRKIHLKLHRHLAAAVIMCLVLVWFFLNGSTMIPNAYVSGSVRIIASASMFTLFLGGLWLFRDFLTRQLGITSLRLPLNLQILGWGLTVIPFFRAVLLARVTPLNELLMTDYPLIQHRLFQVTEFIDTTSALLICSGLLLMAWRLKPAHTRLYGFARLFRWVAFLGGLIFAYSSTGQIMNLFGVNFVVMSDAIDSPVRIGLNSRFQPMENALWLSSGINWLDTLSQIFMVLQVALLAVMALLFFRAYLHNSYWLKQASEQTISS